MSGAVIVVTTAFMPTGSVIDGRTRVPLRRWLYEQGIARKLVLINLLPFAMVIVLTIVLFFTVKVLSGVRAYVAGEGFYSKYQKDAVFYLQRYIQGHDDSDYLRYLRDIRVPVGDALARQALEQVPPDRTRAAQYFVQGGNAPDDTPNLISLFLYFRGFPFVERAVQIWAGADILIERLVETGISAHQRISAGQMSPDEKSLTLQRISELNDQLIELENDFSRTLGDGFAFVSRLLLSTVVAFACLVMGLGFLFSRAVGRSIAHEIASLSQSVGRIAAGDFSARAEVISEDELGQLAQSINAMASNIEHVRHNLEEARDAALQSARTKSEFITNMSREIETPLYTVMGNADFIEEQFGDDPDSGLAGHARAIRGAGERLETTVQRMLDFSQIEAGTFALHPVPLSPAALLLRQVRNLEARSREKALELQCTVEEPAQTMILFDEYCLSGALANLLSNAIKFTERGSVVARLFRANHGLRIEVRDTGIGIDRGHRMHLFEAFAKSDFGYSYRYQGSGLGLALTRSYLQLNRAGLTVDSTPGKGSTFTIEFPLECEIADGHDPTRVTDGDSAFKPSALVVDDDPGCRLLIKSVLGKNYRVQLAASADEAKSIVLSQREKIDLILTDISRRDVDDGLALPRVLREDPRNDRIPIVGLGLNGSADDRARAFTAGCNAYLKKPVSSAYLLATVDRLTYRSPG